MTRGPSPEALAGLAERVPDGALRPRVLVLRGFHPPRAAAGPVADWISLVGGDPFRAAPEGWGSAQGSGLADGAEGDLEVSWEEVLEFDPQLVLLGVESAETDAVAAWMAIEGWNRVEAAERGGLVAVPAGFCRPGPGLEADLVRMQGWIGARFWGWPAAGDSGGLRR